MKTVIVHNFYGLDPFSSFVIALICFFVVFFLTFELWHHVAIFWHDYILRHNIRKSRVSVPMFDPSAKGLLYKCDCGKVWAR